MSLSALHGSVRGLVLWASRPPILGGAGNQVVYSLLRVPVHTAYGRLQGEEQAGLWALQRAPISPSLGPADPGKGGPKSLLPQRMREETFSKLWRRYPGLIHVEAGIGRATSAACSPLLQRPETRVMCGT